MAATPRRRDPAIYAVFPSAYDSTLYIKDVCSSFAARTLHFMTPMTGRLLKGCQLCKIHSMIFVQRSHGMRTQSGRRYLYDGQIQVNHLISQNQENYTVYTVLCVCSDASPRSGHPSSSRSPTHKSLITLDQKRLVIGLTKNPRDRVLDSNIASEKGIPLSHQSMYPGRTSRFDSRPCLESIKMEGIDLLCGLPNLVNLLRGHD